MTDLEIDFHNIKLRKNGHKYKIALQIIKRYPM